jgi:cardiolipin synthase
MLKFIPNIITVLRILLAFLFIPIFLEGRYSWATVIFFVAAVSDFFDGYIARKFGITSKFGAMMDPVADKVLMFVLYLLFAHEKIIPYYLAVVVILRDLLILAVVLICLIKKIKLKFSPLMSSKINTTVQLTFVMLVLTCKTFSINLSLDTLVLFVCGMTIYSGLDYARRYKWIKNELCS